MRGPICRMILCVVAILALMCAPVWGSGGNFVVYRDYRDIPGVTSDDIAAVERLKEEFGSFVYGLNPSSECFTDEDGTIGGFGALFCRRMSEMFGVPFSIVSVEWNELVRKLDTHEINFSSELTPTPERRLRYHMSVPITERPLKLFRKQESEKIDDIALVRRPRYAFLDGTTTCDKVRAGSRQEFDAVFVYSYDEVANMLKSDAVDAFIEEATAEAAFDAYDFIVTTTFLPLLYSPVSFTTPDDRLAPFVAVMDKYLNNGGIRELIDLQIEGHRAYLRHKLFARLTPDEKDYIHRHAGGAAIPMIAEYDNYPSCFYNETEQEFQGIAIDVLKEISSLCGLTFAPVNRADEIWSDLLARLESGEVAFISELLRSSRREGRYLWPKQAYATDSFALLSPSDVEDIDVNQILYTRIGLIRDSAYEDVFHEWFPGHPDTVTYDTNDEAFAALEKGEVRLVMATRNLLLSLTNYREKPGFKTNIVFDRVYRSYFGFSKKEPLLCSIIDKAQALVGTEILADRWTRRVFDYRSKIARGRIPWLIGFAVALGLGLVTVTLLFMKNRDMNRNLEHLVRERTRELEVQTRSAQAASLAKSAFLARMSHEIRTPLNAVMGMARIAQNSLDRPEKAMSCLEEIDSASAHLLAIVNDVLDMSKIEAGRFEIINEPFSLRQTMDEVGDIIRSRCVEKGVAFLFHRQNLPDVDIIGDRTRLKQVLINLLGNAVKFTDHGGRIDFSVDAAEETDGELELTFRVADTGIGMTNEQVGRLFVAFEQADASIATRFGGTGLGLAISRNLVNLMGGDISVQSRPGEGSTFAFTLRFPKGGTAQPSGVSEQAGVPDLTGRRILLAEDIEINRLILKELLAETHVAIDEAEDGKRAVERFEQSPPGYYDLIFMDVQMPEMNGYDATARIRALPRPDAKTVPIVAMTANAYREDIERAMASGMNGHLAKPIDIDAVLRLLAEKLVVTEH